MARLIRWAVAGQVPATQIPDAAQYPSAVVSVVAVVAQVHVRVAGAQAQQPAPVRGDRHLTGLSIVVGEPVLDRALNRERVAEAGRASDLAGALGHPPALSALQLDPLRLEVSHQAAAVRIPGTARTVAFCF